jgi:ankyrin repeat protein
MKARKKQQLPRDFQELLADGDLAILRAVFDACDVNARGGCGKQTALAFDVCSDELARWLVAKGAGLSAVDTWGNTPLHSRAGSRRGAIDVLLELGADVHAAGASIGTPLHAAADRKNVQNAAALLAHGADVNAKNKEGLTSLELALRGCSNADLVQMELLARTLLKAGAKRTTRMAGFVTEIGKRFEFHRAAFAKDLLQAASAAVSVHGFSNGFPLVGTSLEQLGGGAPHRPRQRQTAAAVTACACARLLLGAHARSRACLPPPLRRRRFSRGDGEARGPFQNPIPRRVGVGGALGIPP